MNVSCKRFKHDTETLPHKTHQKAFKTIEETIKQFHLDISIGPIYICTCCHQTRFRKSVSMLKNTIPEESKRLYCTDYMSVNNEEWVCHTCLSALRERKCPKLSVGKWLQMAKQTCRTKFASAGRKINSTLHSIYAD